MGLNFSCISHRNTALVAGFIRPKLLTIDILAETSFLNLQSFVILLQLPSTLLSRAVILVQSGAQVAQSIQSDQVW